ncbi:hypothetical protein JP75_21965 [Devosia riboflavina]|uniref:Uncharacterized protein n=1 Tax=Devosia riboflavina TaxID=46914 RepID=A0A087LX91_9HYPH|nr:hypothetical protein [Devosia riboflavina]KFL29244.1 hypothetical protein JP75_21965 [Devosia riboflavina]
MFHLTRRFHSALPLAWLGAGFLDSLMLLALPALVMLAHLVRRHQRIVGLVGTAPWASLGFARHVMVDDLVRLAAWTALSPFVFLFGHQLRRVLIGS